MSNLNEYKPTTYLKRVRSGYYLTKEDDYYVVRQESKYWCWGQRTKDGDLNISGEDYYTKTQAHRALDRHLVEENYEQELWNT
jgi:hypothetical protein